MAEPATPAGPGADDLASDFTRHAGVEVPIICGPMYPCSNAELVAAASEAGGLGVLQPMSLTYVHGHDFREGIRLMRRLTSKPIGMNALIEQSSKIYHERMVRWVEIALEEGLHYPFVGNVPGHPGNNTYCPKCGKVLIERKGFFVTGRHVVDGRCDACKTEIAGVWD